MENDFARRMDITLKDCYPSDTIILYLYTYFQYCKCIPARIALYFDVAEGKIEDHFDIIWISNILFCILLFVHQYCFQSIVFDFNHVNETILRRYQLHFPPFLWHDHAMCLDKSLCPLKVCRHKNTLTLKKLKHNFVMLHEVWSLLCYAAERRYRNF